MTGHARGNMPIASALIRAARVDDVKNIRDLVGTVFSEYGLVPDPELDAAPADKQRVNWRSFWDGGDTAGPIATKWNVTGWPTIYVVDHKGVIRAKHLYDHEEIENILSRLISEAELDTR